MRHNANRNSIREKYSTKLSSLAKYLDSLKVESKVEPKVDSDSIKAQKWTETPTAAPSCWEKFCLLMWKNWLLQWRHKTQSIIEILIPALFCVLVVVIRSLIDPLVVEEDTTYEPLTLMDFFVDTPEFQLDFFDDLRNRFKNISIITDPKPEIVFSPRGPATESLMQRYLEIFLGGFGITELPDGIFGPLSGLVALDNATELERHMVAENSALGVEMPDEYRNLTVLPDVLSYSLRFPGELRSAFGQIWANWRTDQLFPLLPLGGAENPKYSDGGLPPGYFQEKFLFAQTTMFRAFSSLKNNTGDVLPDIYLRRFPYPPFITDPMLQGMERMFSLFVLLSFVYPCINMVKFITTEKEKQLKETMKIMGLPSWLHWTAWFIKCFTFLLFSTAIMVILLKVDWYPDKSVTVFTNTSWSVLWVFLLIYSIATIMFVFMLSVFFSKANAASAVAGLLWFVTYIPFSYVLQRHTSFSTAAKLFTCIYSNSAMGFGFFLILQHEGTGIGVHWSNLFEPINIEGSMSLGQVIIMLLFDSVLYLLVALYVEKVFPGDYGIPEEWNFPFKRSFWLGEEHHQDVEDEPKVMNEGDFEADPIGVHPGIETRNLRKVYPNEKVAVRGLDLRMFKDQITVLLGHNGAGKTTTVSMLTGMIPPTAGAAYINGMDVRGNIEHVRSVIGLCPQHNVLFDELTVREHIVFFGRLKGLPKEYIDDEVRKYVQLLQLEDKENSQSKTLSGGMKRKLSIGVALCADSKVVLCDEPTSGVDPAARRALWDLLMAEKKGRTILLTTHFMDEADILGDRIAIMADGELKAVGSSFFLKKRFGKGYRLVCVKGKDCNTRKVTEVLRRFIPDITVETDIGTELSYQMDGTHSALFERMLEDLEVQSRTLDLQSYGISLTTLEEVFMKVGTDKETEGSTSAVANGNNNHVEMPDEVLIPEVELLTGRALLFNQLRGLFLKQIIHSTRTWPLVALQNVIPVIFLMLTIFVVHSWGGHENLPPFRIVPEQYTPTVTILESNVTDESNLTTRLLDSYRMLFDDADSTRQSLIDSEGEMDAFYLRLGRKMIASMNSRYLFGASINETVATAWFSNQPYHAAPISLSLLLDAALKTVCGPECAMKVTNKPLPYRAESRFELLTIGINHHFLMPYNLGFAMAFVSAFYVLLYTKERVTKSKLLQFVSGVNVASYWSTAFVWDYLTFTFTALVSLATVGIFQEEGWYSWSDLGRFFLVLLVFGWAMLPLTYLASRSYSLPATGFTKLTFNNIFLGCSAFSLIFTMRFEGFNLKDTADQIANFLLVVPHFALCDALRSLTVLSTTISVCDQRCAAIPDCNLEWLCDSAPEMARCCEREYYAWSEPGIAKHLVYMGSFGLLSFVLLLLLEYRMPQRLIQLCLRVKGSSPLKESEDGFVDVDVLEEKRRVANMTPEERVATNLILHNATKQYGRLTAVNQLSVGVNHSECFGLLGVNGAGKTTTFKMLTGDEPISAGEAWIQGYSLKTAINEVHLRIGYCPQFDALIDELTGRETMTIFALFRGIPRPQIAAIVTRLAAELNFSKHIDKPVKEYSGGNKRKLSTAVALIGNPYVIFLDEPTTGMDPGAKRQLWSVVCKARDQGRTIVLTSHSMEECEALCTRLAIMVNGEFKCLGSAQHLKNKFAKGYVLTVKLRRGAVGEADEAMLRAVKRYIEEKFPLSHLKEEHQGLLTYHVVVSEQLKWSKMFGIMEEAKSLLSIEDYSIGQTSLEQVFLSFTKYQREGKVSKKIV